jgi:hypothetical protein
VPPTQHDRDDLLRHRIRIGQDVVRGVAQHQPALPDQPVLAVSVGAEHVRGAVELAAGCQRVTAWQSAIVVGSVTA